MSVTAASPETEPPAGMAAVSRNLVRNVHAPFAARRFVRAQVLSWGLSGLLDDLEVVVNELAANAFEHGAGHFISVRLELRGSSVTVKVWDENDAKLPETVGAGLDDEHGRGLMLTGALSARWGAYRSTTGGKVVWAECR